MNKHQLKACPFCGGNTIKFSEYITNGKEIFNNVRLSCRGCGVHFVMPDIEYDGFTVEQAKEILTDHWNQRA